MIYVEYLAWAKKVQDRGEKAYGELGGAPSLTRLSGARGALAEVKLVLELADKVEMTKEARSNLRAFLGELEGLRNRLEEKTR